MRQASVFIKVLFQFTHKGVFFIVRTSWQISACKAGFRVTIKDTDSPLEEVKPHLKNNNFDFEMRQVSVSMKVLFQLTR